MRGEQSEPTVLYERLVAAKLAGTRNGSFAKDYEYVFHSNEQAAAIAVDVVLGWLTDESVARESHGDEKRK